MLRKLDCYIEERIHWPDVGFGESVEPMLKASNDHWLRPSGPYVINNIEVLITHHDVYVDDEPRP